jgi:serine carboxypeptidase-like clade 2
LFFVRFPSYRKSELYLTGHGYAAVYNIKLAKEIIEENNDPFVIYNDNFNLKGTLLGNPCINPDECHSSGT